METTNEEDLKPDSSKPEEAFKKPILIGKIGKLPKKVIPPTDNENVIKTFESSEKEDLVPEPDPIEPLKVEKPQLQQVTLSYKEPSWSGLPETDGISYKFEVLKNGCIIETLDLMRRPFWTFGRLADCNICMQHPTISRYHAILQYRSVASETEAPGFYIYDLGGTHGTFLNKRRLRPKIYARIQVGHMLRFGCSSRSYILVGPETDAEAESELSVTELKQKRVDQLRKLEEDAARVAKEEEERRIKEEERGVNWGMGEDAEEETDLTENPFAQTNNEQLYLDDPKKALRGFFEREGFNLEYDCSEQGLGQFLCKVELPIDDEVGRPIIAEVLHKGKKKEAVIQCALEACRILDRHGVLRQAIHESRKRKSKNWEENDYYDSDDDTFLDRTGTIEKKREKRMQSKQPQQPETYESLLEKENELSESIKKIEIELEQAESVNKKNKSSSNEEDSLDSYMKELSQPKMDKHTAFRLKMELAKLKKEHANVIRLANIAKPAHLGNLEERSSTSAGTNKASKFPLFGKRLKVGVKVPKPAKEESANVSEEEAEEMDTVDKCEVNETPEQAKKQTRLDMSEVKSFKSVLQSLSEKVEEYLKNNDAKKDKEEFKNILSSLEKIVISEDCSEPIEAKQLECLIKTINDFIDFRLGSNVDDVISVELNRVLDHLKEITTKKMNAIPEIHKETNKVQKKFKTIDSEHQTRLESSTSDENPANDEKIDEFESEEKRKKKNQRRIHQRQEKAAIEKERGYQEDAVKANYSMWVPPTDQSGDGRTNLNEKYGY